MENSPTDRTHSEADVGSQWLSTQFPPGLFNFHVRVTGFDQAEIPAFRNVAIEHTLEDSHLVRPLPPCKLKIAHGETFELYMSH
eukprot:UN28645